MIKNKTLNLEQWENEDFLGATDLTPELIEIIRSNITLESPVKNLENPSTFTAQANQEEWMFI